MSIASRFIARARSIHPDDFDDAENFADDMDNAIALAAADQIRLSLGYDTLGPVGPRARRIIDRASADASHFDARGDALVPAETVTLELSDWRRRTIVPVVAASIRRAA